MEQGRQGALTIPQRPGIVLDPITPYDSVPFGSFGLGPLQQNRVGTAALAMDVFRRARRSWNEKGRGHFQYGLNRTLLAVGKPPESQKRGLQLRKTQYIFSLDLFLLVVKREGKYLGRFCVSKQPYNTTDLSKQKYAFCLASVFFFSFQIVSFGYKEVLMADNKITTRRNIISCIFLFSKMRGR